MWTAAARAKSQRRVTVQCDGCQTQLERPAIRAGQPNYCDACKAGRQRQLNAEWYAANREQALRRDAERRAKRQQEIAVKAGFIFIRGNKHHDYLTLVELPADDWPTPALLTRTAWEALVAAGDLAGALRGQPGPRLGGAGWRNHSRRR